MRRNPMSVDVDTLLNSVLLVEHNVMNTCKFWANGQVAKAKLLFYCHYPDLLLCVERRSFLKRCYRRVFDWLERKTMCQCDILCVNSEFTKRTFCETFPGDCDSKSLYVLHPPVDLTEIDELSAELRQYAEIGKSKDTTLDAFWKRAGANLPFFLSLNRYERKKGIPVALRAFCRLQRKDVHLVIAGGYDPRVPENVEHYAELETLADELGIRDRVIFLRSISNIGRYYLMRESIAVVYTPENEHFGIVPVEAMSLSSLVVASNSGGPIESVGSTGGFLVDHSVEGFHSGMQALLDMDRTSYEQLRKSARARVEQMFALSAFTRKLGSLLNGASSGTALESVCQEKHEVSKSLPTATS